MSDATGPQADALAARLRADFGVRAIAVQADVATPAGAELLVRRAVDELEVGKVHILGTSGVPHPQKDLSPLLPSRPPRRDHTHNRGDERQVW